MIAMKYVEEMVREVKEKLSVKINHSFFTTYIEAVEINEAELSMLVVILQEMDLTEEQILHYATTIMLIQIALDTHEKVTDADSLRMNKQLTVLAGDYFSGWYYYLLAENKDIQLIGDLAIGIKEINENKIRLYRNEYKDFEEAMNLIKQIEMGLVKRGMSYFSPEIDANIIEKMFLLNRLNDEQRSIDEKKPSSTVEQIKHRYGEQALFNLENYRKQLQQQIQQEILEKKSLQYIYDTYM